MDELRWFHVIISTYGSWLRGDPRGFRTRHHREHVEGDYKHPPPPGQYESLERYSRSLLKQPPVVLSPEWRPIIGTAVRERLIGLGAQVICLAAGGQHCHYLAKGPPSQARPWAGLAKKHAWFVARDRGWVGKLWAVRGKVIPIRDRQHQLNAFQYILDHVHEGAWTWSILQKQ